MISTFLFDLDGTLIDPRIYARIYSPIMKMVKRKLKLSEKELSKKIKSFGLVKNSQKRYDSGEICREFGLMKEYYQILKKEIRKNKSWQKPMIQEIKKIKNHRIGIVSNSFHRTIKLYLTSAKLKVDFIFGSDNAGCKKDKPEYWKRLIRQYHLRSKECLVVGDNLKEDYLVPRKFGFSTKKVKFQ